MRNECKMTISGSVHYLNKIMPPVNSTLYVTLFDVSKADAPAKQLAHQTIANAEKSGYKFQLVYNTADVVDGNRYAILAQIKTGDQLEYTTTEHYPVQLGVNQSEPIEILVQRGGRP